MIPRLVASALLLAWLCSTAQAQSMGGVASVTGEIDADHFSAMRVRAGGLVDYQSPWQYSGVAAQENFYSQSGWHRNATSVLGLWRDQSRDTLAGVNAEVGVIEFAGHTRPVGDASWGLRPSADTGVELLAAAGLVETQAAIEQGIGYTFWGASLEQKVTERLTVIALAAYQPFTDGNDRVHLRARVVWDALPDQGVNLQVRWRQYHDRTTTSAAPTSIRTTTSNGSAWSAFASECRRGRPQGASVPGGSTSTTAALRCSLPISPNYAPRAPWPVTPASHCRCCTTAPRGFRTRRTIGGALSASR